MAKPTVEFYMWGYQLHFQLSADRTARELFDEILPGADPLLFLVGVLGNERNDRHPVCVEPGHGPIQPSAFTDLDSVMLAITESDDRSQMCYSNSIAAGRVHQRIADDALVRAIEQCCSVAEGQERYYFFASFPTVIDDFFVCCVLRCRRDEYDRQVHLTGDKVDRVPVVRSLIEAVIIEFLAECQIALRESDAGANLCVIKASIDDLRRRGGRRFMKAIGWRAFGGSAYSTEGIVHVEQLGDAMTSVAAMRHEGDEAIGRFVICQRSNPSVAYTVRLKSPVRLTAKRRVRKLLELSRDALSLVVTDAGVEGLATILDAGTSEEALFQIDVLGHHIWRLRHADDVLCEFRYGLPAIPRSRLSVDEFVELCERVLPVDSALTELWKIVEACMAQAHGTMLVVSTRASREADRLANQSTPIEPQALTVADVHAITSIDGALFVDHAGICHAIGVILDGMATDLGDPGRGARFNSAIRYLESHGDGCLICIVSEDGDVNLLPKLAARVKRSVVEAAVSAMADVARELPLNPRKFAERRNAVDKHRFYLDEELCRTANAAVATAEGSEDEGVGSIRIVRPPFVPNRGMNDSYWLPE